MEIEKQTGDGSSDVQRAREPEDLQPLADRQGRQEGDSQPRARLSDEMEAAKMVDMLPKQKEDHQDSSPVESKQSLKVEDFDGEQHREDFEDPQLGDELDRQKMGGVQHRAQLSDETEAEKMEDVDTLQQQGNQQGSSSAENTHSLPDSLKVEDFDASFDGEKNREDVQDPRPDDKEATQKMEGGRVEQQHERSVPEADPEKMQVECGADQQQLKETPQDLGLTDDAPTRKLEDVDLQSQNQHKNPQDGRVADGPHALEIEDVDTNNPVPREVEGLDAQKVLADPHDPSPVGETQLRNLERSSLDAQREGDTKKTHGDESKDKLQFQALPDDVQQPGQVGDTKVDELEGSKSKQECDSEDLEDSEFAGKGAAAGFGGMKQQQLEDAQDASPAQEMLESEMPDVEIRQQLEDPKDASPAAEIHAGGSGTDGSAARQCWAGDNKSPSTMEDSDVRQAVPEEDVEIQDSFPLGDERTQKMDPESSMLDVQQLQLENPMDLEARPADEIDARRLEALDAEKQLDQEDPKDAWPAAKNYAGGFGTEGMDVQHQREDPRERWAGEHKRPHAMEDSDMQQKDAEIQDSFPADDERTQTMEISRLDELQQAREALRDLEARPGDIEARRMEGLDTEESLDDQDLEVLCARLGAGADKYAKELKSLDIMQHSNMGSFHMQHPNIESFRLQEPQIARQESRLRDDSQEQEMERRGLALQLQLKNSRDPQSSEKVQRVITHRRLEMEGGEFLRQSQHTENLIMTMGSSDQMQHQPQNREIVWYNLLEHQNDEQRDQELDPESERSMREQKFGTGVSVVQTTAEQEFQQNEHTQDKAMVWKPQMHIASRSEGGDLELFKPSAIVTEDSAPLEQICKPSDIELSLAGGTWTTAKRSTIFLEGSEKPDGEGAAPLATRTNNQPVPLNSAVLNFIGRVRAPGPDDHAVAHAYAQMENMSWPTSDITRQLLETSIIGQQRGASNSAPAIADAAITTEQVSLSDFGKINLGYTLAPEPESKNGGRFDAAPGALEPVNDLGGSEGVAAGLQVLQNLQGSEDGASEIPDSNRSSAFTGKSGVYDDLGEVVTTLLPENSKEETFQAPSAGMAGTILSATETLSSESQNFERVQYPTVSPNEEASRVSSLERQIDATVTARVRAEIMSHPTFPEMLAAHGACLRVTIPDNHMLGVSEQLMRSEELLRAYSAFVRGPAGHDERGDSSHRQQMDNFMRSHTDALWDLHTQLEDSVPFEVKNALLFTARVENEIKNLCSASRAQDSENNSDPGNNKASHIQHTAESMSDEFGPIVPMGSEHSIMKGIRDQLKQKYGEEGFWKKITEVRDEIVRKRRAGKLPTGTTAILKEWWTQHIEWPYPAEEDKERFMEETGLELKQINNWFINQRKRNWNNGASSSKSNERRNKQRA